MRPDLILGNNPRNFYIVDKNKSKAKKWLWRSFWWGLFWGVVTALPLGYMWRHFAAMY